MPQRPAATPSCSDPGARLNPTATGYPEHIANLSNTVKSLGGAIEKLAEYAKSHETRIKRLEKQVKKLEKADRARKEQRVRSRKGR